MWPADTALDAIIRAAVATRRELAASGEPPAGRRTASAAGRMPLALIAGSLAEATDAGPELAQWLASTPPAQMNGFSLAGAAAAARRLASWAHACEMAAVAEIAARAVQDGCVPTGNGRPGQVPQDAVDEVALALCMPRPAAARWAARASALVQRLPDTLSALRAGRIDLSRARLVADATSGLDQDTARAVQDLVLPSAGQQTLGRLRAALRAVLPPPGEPGPGPCQAWPMTWTAPTPRPVDGPLTGDDRPILEGFLNWQRTTLLNICAGLTGEQLASRPVPSSALSLLGLVRHLAKVERIWFRQRAAGQPVEPLYDPSRGKDADFTDGTAEEASIALERLQAEWRHADEAVKDMAFTDTFDVHGEAFSLRMAYVHVIAEYARHNGHADILREGIDGVTGR
jgi:hypothetical protein